MFFEQGLGALVRLVDETAARFGAVDPPGQEPELGAGRVVVDSTRFVTDKAAAKRFPGLHFVTLRMCWLAVEHVRADHFLAAVRKEHQAFYRRTFKHREICPPRPYAMLKAPIEREIGKELDKRFAPALEGLTPGQPLLLLYWMDKARRDTGNYLDWLTAEVGKALDEWQDLGDTVEQLSDAPAFAHLKFFDGWHKRNVHQTYMQFEAVR